MNIYLVIKEASENVPTEVILTTTSEKEAVVRFEKERDHTGLRLIQTALSDKIPTGQKMSDCQEILNSIPGSGYWPFASPAPSSTECKIKNYIESAVTNLEGAIILHEHMFGKTYRNETIPPSVKIEKLI